LKRKSIILCASIIGLMIIGYTTDRVYHVCSENHKELAVKNNDNDNKSTKDTPGKLTPPTEPSKENPPNPPVNNAEEKPTTYKLGDKGDKIKEIQQRLVKYGYDLVVDGEFGPETYNAIWDFQGRLCKTKDGIIGSETISKLNEEPTEKTRYTPPAIPTFGNTVTQASLEQFVNENTFASNTNFLVWVDLSRQKVNLFIGSYKNWKLIKSMSCGTGKSSTPTVTGSFTIQDKGEYFRVNSGVICKYYTRFYGNYLFHTVLLDNDGNIVDGTLGTPVSHGCIRLAIEDAKYIYDNVPMGTMVWIK